MNKQYEIEGYTFNVCVYLNYRTERRLGGTTEHLIIINDMGSSNFYKKVLIKEGLQAAISELVKEAEQYVAMKTSGALSEDELILKNLEIV